MNAEGPWLGVDYGFARLGLARSDRGGLIASPFEVHPSEGMENDAQYVAELAQKMGAVGIIVGLPKRLDGSESSGTRKVAEFARLLETTCDLPVITWDERLSTAEANKALRDAGLSRKRRAEQADKVAAALILQAYLDRQRGSIRLGGLTIPSLPSDEQGMEAALQTPDAAPALPRYLPAGEAPSPPAAIPETIGKRLPLRTKALATAISILAILAFSTLWLMSPPLGGKREVRFKVPANATASSVALALKRQHLVRNATLFSVLSRLKGVDNDFKAGVHLLDSSLSTPQIISSLTVGDRRLRDILVTIPEGYSLLQIAQALQESGVVPTQDFLGAAQSEAVAAGLVSFPLPEGSLEGYLFPDTYYFVPDSEPQAVVAKMLGAFEKKVYGSLRAETTLPPPLRSFHEAVILASLVEREAKLPQERPLIAGVYLNRLRKGMKLECDATVQYALGRHKPRLLYSDLKVNSPYNTYLQPGLPPGPICNPGLDSIRAAFNPVETDYLYYVAQSDGSHIFSRTYADHLAVGG